MRQSTLRNNAMADRVVFGCFGAAGVPSLEETAAKGLSCSWQGEAGWDEEGEKDIIMKKEKKRSSDRLGRRYHHRKGIPDSIS